MQLTTAQPSLLTRVANMAWSFSQRYWRVIVVAMLALLHIAIGFVWLSGYAWFIDQIGGVLTRPRVKAWIERVTGGLLVALGLRLAWERR